MFKLHFFNIEAFGALRIDLVLHIDAFEGEVSVEHAEHQHSDCPDIHLVIIDFFFEDLGSHVGGSAAKSIDIFIVLTTKSQIADFD